MVVRDGALVVPTLDHARAAAAVLTDDGAASVLLFGSVADGRARPGSDIDLVAVFDDIDYGERYPHKWRLEAKCAAAAGVPVEVHVTDWPEWRTRIRRVRSSFEAAVSARSLILHERAPQPGSVDWGKEIVVPDSDLEEAVGRMTGVRRALGGMAASCRQREGETATVAGSVEVVAHVRDDRLRDLCADAAMAIENSLKALTALNGDASKRSHDVARLVERARPLPDTIEAALEPLRENTLRPSLTDWDDITCWRIGASYPMDLPQATPERTERVVRLLTHAAVTVADATLDRLLGEGADPDDERLAYCRDRLATAMETLTEADAVTGIERPSPTAS